MKKLKNILLIIVAAFKHFCRWTWKDYWIWTSLIIGTIISMFFTHPLMSLFCFVVYAIPGAFVSWGLWRDKKRRFR